MPNDFYPELLANIQPANESENPNPIGFSAEDAADKYFEKIEAEGNWIESQKSAQLFFQSICSEEIWPLVNQVVGNIYFQKWSGAGSKEKHHYGTGGLFRHTFEVVYHAYKIAKAHEELTGEKLRIDELIVAAIWHDFGKMWDYQQKNGVWGKFNEHAREIHHVSKSAIEFNKFIGSRIKLPKGFNVEHVTHIILAHHGRREWGSPVAPHTQEAWIVHTADNISARLNDHKTHKPF